MADDSVIIAAAIVGRPLAEIAKLAGTSISTVQRRLARPEVKAQIAAGRAQLRDETVGHLVATRMRGLTQLDALVGHENPFASLRAIALVLSMSVKFDALGELERRLDALEAEAATGPDQGAHPLSANTLDDVPDEDVDEYDGDAAEAASTDGDEHDYVTGEDVLAASAQHRNDGDDNDGHEVGHKVGDDTEDHDTEDHGGENLGAGGSDALGEGVSAGERDTGVIPGGVLRIPVHANAPKASAGGSATGAGVRATSSSPKISGPVTARSGPARTRPARGSARAS